MRRTDREITDRAQIMEIARRCTCCRLGFCTPTGAYIVPMNFGVVEREDGTIDLYFHSATEGLKLDYIRQQPHIGFEMDGAQELVPNEVACGFSYRFESIIGEGEVRLVEDPEEKRMGLQAVMEHYSGKNDWDMPETMLARVAVIRLTVMQWSCKKHGK